MSVQTVFDTTAATYDPGRRKLIPCFDRFYTAATELIPADAAHVTDLGAGTGLLSAFLRQRLPSSQLHLIDISEPMLVQARNRLADDPRVTAEIADYSTAPLPQDQDVIASALSIHHLEHPAKRDLFARIRHALRPGGLFINADQIAGPTPALELEYQQRWLAAVRACGASDQQISDSLYRQREDRRAPIGDQLQWLTDAGFTGVDCWFKDGSFAVFLATRPA